MFDECSVAGASRVLILHDAPSGLRAVIALDDLTLGPACGGIRTRAYRSDAAALRDAAELAAAMTLKCAIAGLAAGGGKTVVLDHPGLDRATAFRRLGGFIEDLGGLYRTAGDLGTTIDDLNHAAETTRFVNTTGPRLGEATGEGIVNCMRAVARAHGHDGLAGLTIAVQGCGLIGAGVARSLRAQGADLVLGDTDEALARALADELGAAVVPAARILATRADIVSPCAIGGVLTADSVGAMTAWAVCGGANNQLAAAEVADLLRDRGITYVPDFLASAGAVIEGIAPSVMGLAPEPLIAGLFDTTVEVLEAARAEARNTVDVAKSRARARIDAVRLQDRSKIVTDAGRCSRDVDG